MEESINISSEQIPLFQPSNPIGEQLRDLQYSESSFRFEENAGYFNSAKLSVLNNFLKTVDEIESDFMHMIKGPRANDEEVWCNMEENY